MRKVKHNKIRNTGLLYEFLLRQITLDVLNSDNTSNAVQIIKKRFNENSELGKELALYNILSTRKFKDDEEKRKNQILTAGGAFLSATKEAVKDAFIPTHMHNARIAGPQSKRKEILTESKLRGQRQSADAFASQMTLRNILEQAGYKTGKILKGGAMELSYVYDTLPFNQ